MSPSLLGRREAFRLETEDVDFDFMALSYMETKCPSPLKTMTVVRRLRHDGNSFAIRLILLRHIGTRNTPGAFSSLPVLCSLRVNILDRLTPVVIDPHSFERTLG
jgi:hypothetical protein